MLIVLIQMLAEIARTRLLLPFGVTGSQSTTDLTANQVVCIRRLASASATTTKTLLVVSGPVPHERIWKPASGLLIITMAEFCQFSKTAVRATPVASDDQ
jgi:hypothetical protein